MPSDPGQQHDPFLWGVATSAYQSEGGFNGPGQPWTNWFEPEESGRVMRSGKAADFWNRYAEDFARCRDLGLNAFRLGISWSRVQPGTTGAAGPGPPMDTSALDHYARIIASCRSHGLEPVVTLHHFVHPAWLGPDPWLHDETPGLFASHCGRLVHELGRRLIDNHGQNPPRYFITINEPNMFVLNTYVGNQFPSRARRGFGNMVRAYAHLLAAHVHAYNAIHDACGAAGWPAPMVTFNNYCSDLYWSDKLLLDLVSTKSRGIGRADAHAWIWTKSREMDDAFRAARIPLHRDIPYYFGAVFKAFTRWLGNRQFDAGKFAPLFDALDSSPRAQMFDYLGLDYYDPFAAHLFRIPSFRDHEFRGKSLRSWMMNAVTSKWWDWRVLPRGLEFFCDYYSRDFGGLPVLIAENGMAMRRTPDNQSSPRRDRMTRSQFLRLHVHEVTRIVQKGIPLIGYLHWSLFDNYEWGSFTPRFGLYSIDYSKGTERLPADLHGDRPAETYARLVHEARQKIAAHPHGHHAA